MLALVTLWKRPRWAAAPIALALIVLLVGSNACFALGAIAEGQNIPSAELPNAEALSSWVVQQNQLFHHAHR